MEVIAIQEETKEEEKTALEHFYNFKGTPMVRFKGNFYRGGFNVSKNKVRAVIENLEIMKQFINGDFDEAIAGLQEGQALKP